MTVISSKEIGLVPVPQQRMGQPEENCKNPQQCKHMILATCIVLLRSKGYHPKLSTNSQRPTLVYLPYVKLRRTEGFYTVNWRISELDKWTNG